MARWAPIELDSDSILLADDDLIAIDKAPGVLSDASIDPNRDHLGRALERWAQENLPTAASHEFHPAHRLDKGTSGVVLFARNRHAATALMQQFQDRTVTKRYHAVVTPSPRNAWAVGDAFDRRSYLRHRRGVSEEVRSGGKPAESRFEVLAIADRYALVDAAPQTGRTHQLRVHLAALDAPIVGDDRYGTAGGPHSSRLWLHAHTLQLTHPSSGEPLMVRSRVSLHLDDRGPVEFAPKA